MDGHCPPERAGGGPGDAHTTFFHQPEGEPETALEPRRTTLVRRLLALLVMLTVALFLLGGVLRLLQIPTLDFLRESRLLAEDPGIRQWRAAVVQVRAVYPARVSTGSGFNVDPAGLIITNRHVVEDAAAITVTFEDGISYNAAMVVTSDRFDLAVVILSQAADLPSVSLAGGDLPRPGDEVTVIGNPLGLPGVVIRGQVARYRGREGLDRLLLELAAPIHRGHSGSPVFDDGGRVAGIVFAALERTTPDGEGGSTLRGLAIPAATIQAFLDSLPDYSP